MTAADVPGPGLTPLRQSGPRPSRGQRRAAVVFVHGFTGSPLDTWGGFPDLLAAETALSGWDLYAYGYRSSLLPAVPWWRGDPGPERLWRGLASELRTPPLTGYDSVAFVAHSMGGLVVQRVLVEEAGLAARTSHVVMFGTPSAGLGKAFWGALLNRQARGMTPLAIRRLRKRWGKTFGTDPGGTPTHSFELVVVDGEQDDFVKGTSALEPFDDLYRLTTTGDHLSMVKPSDAGHRSFRIVADRLSGSVGPRSPTDGARVAVELGEFHRAVQLFEREGAVSAAESLDEGALVEYAMALDGVKRREDAIAVLLARSASRTEGDVMGVLAGRYKRRWLSGREAEDADRAEALYRRGYGAASGNPDQEYYHAINVAFMSLLRGRSRAEVNRWARSALDACGRAEVTGPARLWRTATLAEAHLIMRDAGPALREYWAVAENEGDPWHFRSVYHQAMRIAAHERDRATERALRDLFDMPFPPV